MILVIAQVEDKQNIEQQINKQTKRPDLSYIYLDEKPAQGIIERRKRIASNHLLLQAAVRDLKPDFIWQIEADGDYPPNTLKTLQKRYDQKFSYHRKGYVSGVQVGRHGLYALGAWQFNKDRTEFKSVDHKLKGLVQVDATGFYCLFTDTQTWLSGIANWNGEAYGPDVNFGLSLKDQGYDIYVDMDIKIGHITKGGTIHPDDISTENVTFTKTNNKWEYKTSS